MRSLGLVTLSLALACGGRAVSNDDESPNGTTTEPSTGDGPMSDGTTSGVATTGISTSADPTTGGGSVDDDSGGGSTGMLPPPVPEDWCTCVELDLVCTKDVGMATADCELEAPCGRLDAGNDATECVRQLLITQAPARFEYQFIVAGNQIYSGWFYILGPGEGLDNECFEDIEAFENDLVPTAAYYELSEPAYFDACPGDGSDEARGCVLAGLGKLGPVDECAP